MVKGVSQRVVVVRPDENGMFEQAIFLVRDYSVPRSDAVREACRIANSYLMGRTTPQERDGLQTGAGVYCRGAGFERGLDGGQHDFVKTVHTIKTADQLLCTFPMDFI